MKATRIGTFFFSALPLVLGLAACGKDPAKHGHSGQAQRPSDAARAAAPEQGPSSPESPKPEDDWKQIKTFAESIDRVSFSYDEKKKSAYLSVTYRNIDVMGDDGTPVFTSVYGLEGMVGRDGTATLKAKDSPDYEAQLNCLDRACKNAEIRARLLKGTLAGEAVIQQTTRENAGTYTGFDADTARESHLETKVFRSLEASDPRQASFTLRQIEGGRKTFFEIACSFSNVLSPREFDQKAFYVSGTLGEGVRAQLTFVVEQGAATFASVDPYLVNAAYDAEDEAIRVKFIKNAFSDEPEASLFLAVGQRPYHAR